jgi:hypothetical protein
MASERDRESRERRAEPTTTHDILYLFLLQTHVFPTLSITLSHLHLGACMRWRARMRTEKR